MVSDLYATRSQLEAVFASTDIASWADRTNNADPAEIDANVTEALTQATTIIDDILRGGVYPVPFTTVPRMIMDICRKLAGWELYLPRGIQDAEKNRLAPMRKECLDKLRNIREGRMQLDLTPCVEQIPFNVIEPVHRQVDDFAITLINDDGFTFKQVD